MSSPNNIKLEEGVYLRATYINNSKQVVYGLYSDNIQTNQLDSYLKPKIGNTSDFSKTYFVKKSTIPRSKFREYGKDKGWKIVRNTDAATAIIIPDNYFYTDYFYTYRATIFIDLALVKDLLDPNSYFRKYIAQNASTKFPTIYNVITNNISRKLIKDISSDASLLSGAVCEIQYNIDFNSRAKFKKEWEALKSEGKFKIYSSPVGIIPVEKIELFINYKDKLVYDTSIAAKLGDSVISHAEFESIKAMMDSRQVDNINLAVSLVTQCNYSQSMLYLALFLFRYNNRVYDLPCYNLKDYKGLRAYFKDYGDVRRWSLSTFAKIVKDHAHLIDENFRNIMNNEMALFVNDALGAMKNYINIDNVTFKYG